MDRKELSFRLTAELLLALMMAALAASALPLPWATGAALLGAHSASFTLNGQMWVCARYCRWYRRDPMALQFPAPCRRRAAGPALAARSRVHRLAQPVPRGSRRSCGPRPAPRLSAGRRVLAAAQPAAAAMAHAGAGDQIPLDLYATTGRKPCAASTSASACCSCSTATAGSPGSIPAAPLPGRDGRHRLDRDAADLLGVLTGRASGRARARDPGYPLHRPVRRHLRRRPPAAQARQATSTWSAIRAARSAHPAQSAIRC